MNFFHDAKEHIKSKEFFKFLRLLFIFFTSLFFTVNMVIIYGYKTTPDTSFTSFGFTLAALAIACHAVVIAIDSDEKMKAIADDRILENAGKFEDRRLNLQDKRTKHITIFKEQMTKSQLDFANTDLKLELSNTDYHIYYSYGIWKSLTYFRQIKLYNKWISKNQQGYIIKLLYLYFGELIAGRSLFFIKISPEYKNHIKEMFRIVAEYEVYPISQYNNDLYERMLELQK